MARGGARGIPWPPRSGTAASGLSQVAPLLRFEHDVRIEPRRAPGRKDARDRGHHRNCANHDADGHAVGRTNAEQQGRGQPVQERRARESNREADSGESKPFPEAEREHADRAAPSAIRMPTSRRRSVTMQDRTP